jgi:hypothetical protein
MADELVPLVNGGVHLSKMNGTMHDTCNTANLVARKVPNPTPYLLARTHNLALTLPQKL